ncbi:hypothetical protein AAU57_13920 [Nonlabens sp. YIK11]|uniref:helix-turn-helix and ligand-binding sensor domain-containing protein n=1 Tax=Nonlabens sp. YIK11 TaxID=1453349 RepID=UPI0006DC740E|nr:hypothetical protein [Nonlabens sp. YIK11]KQC34314.1 hypothetical protein AAU57_13920 [Nonlabens sp. YIK11]
MQSQKLYPEITNYSYGSSQNWSIDVDASQIISIANNSGLSRFDGQSWSMHPIPKKMIVRSVLCVDDRIYTGSYEEFGYWKTESDGELKYHSLSSKFPKNTPLQSEEFWQIIEHNGVVYFRSFGSIYSYNGSTIALIANSLDISSLAIFNDKLLYSSLSQGLYQFDGYQISSFNEYEELKGLTAINNLKTYEDQIFIYDLNKGGFLIKNGNLINLSNSLNQMLKDDIINKVEFVGSNTIAFGTIKNGVLVYDIGSQKVKVINRQAGIRNNTILDIKVHEGELWLALDNGVSRVAIDGEITFYSDDSGVLGTVYDIAFFKNKYYLASNTGVYTFENNQLNLLENSEGHCWGIHQSNGQLFFGHNRGAFILNGEKLDLIEGSYSGVYDYVAIPNSNDFLISTYSGIGILSNQNNIYSISKLSGLDVPIDNIVVENSELIWATDNFKNLFKITFDPVQKRIKMVNSFQEKELVANNNVDIVKIKKQPYFIIDGIWYAYQEENQKFITTENYKNNLLIGQDQKKLWFLNQDDSRISYLEQDTNESIRFYNQELIAKLVDGYTKIISKNENEAIINLKDGFALINTSKRRQDNNHELIIKNILSNGNRIDLNDDELELSYQEGRSVSFKVYSLGSFDHNLTYRLRGEMKQSEVIVDGGFVLRNLQSGNYQLSIIDNGDMSLKKVISIYVSPPWYLSWWMSIIYITFFLGLLFAAGRYQKIKATKAHEKAQDDLMKRAKQEIEQIEKDNLIRQVESRQKELINRTATIVRKNEAIITLRNELRKLQESSPNKIRTSNILKRTGEQLDSKNDWQLFESKFNSLNEDFFNNLSRRFPKLTSKDQKLCAYIKIGLTSKEIAPLLGITKRSVELQRYRLRKKLDLDTDINFNEFLTQL